MLIRHNNIAKYNFMVFEILISVIAHKHKSGMNMNVLSLINKFLTEFTASLTRTDVWHHK